MIDIGSKAFVKSAIDWLRFLEVVPREQLPSFYALKAKNDHYLRRVRANPGKLPEIKWEDYKKLIGDAKLVDKLMKAYKSFKVPYPADKLSEEVDKQWKGLQPEIEQYVQEIQAVILQSKCELKRLKATPKLNDMTLEMFYDFNRKDALDPVHNPTFWPHTADEQLGYKKPSIKY